jgi:hypothetical protein
MKGHHPMKTKYEFNYRKRGFLLPLLCAGVLAAFLGGCAEGPYVTAYDGGYYYPTAYYTPDYDYYGYPYSYYGPTVAVGGTRYYNRYGTRYYGGDHY